MIIQDSASLSTALDRRLQVARIAMLERAAPIGDADDASGDAVSDDLSGGLASNRANVAPGSLDARLPLGRIVVARVVDVPHPALLVAEVDDLRVELAWPAGGGAAPRIGEDVALRVLAHEPALVLQNVPADELASAAAGDAPDAAAASVPRRLSNDALQLQRSVAPVAAAYRALAALPVDPVSGSDVANVAGSDVANVAGSNPTNVASLPPVEPRPAGPVRFDVPILTLVPIVDEPSALDAVRVAGDAPSPRQADLPVAARDLAHAVDTVTTQGAVDLRTTPSDVASVRDAATVDASPVSQAVHRPDDASPPASFTPLVLQGPAWVGQPIELVVRRERADEALDNPVLDHWCGEVVIDLPRLGRVAGHLSFSMQGLRVRLEADDDASVAAMSAATAELAMAFADVDLRVCGLAVTQPAPDATRPAMTPIRVSGLAYGSRHDG